jgi:predicted nucleic acid-binding protein
MSAVFADTFYFLALANPRDKAHAKCVAFSQSSDRPVITTTWVLMEVGDALSRGADRGVFSQLLEDLAQDAETTVLTASQEMFEKAVALFAARPDKDWSLTDCTSFEVMQQRGLTEALTSDHHFRQAGFVTLLD